MASDQRTDGGVASSQGDASEPLAAAASFEESPIMQRVTMQPVVKRMASTEADDRWRRECSWTGMHSGVTMIVIAADKKSRLIS